MAEACGSRTHHPDGVGIAGFEGRESHRTLFASIGIIGPRVRSIKPGAQSTAQEGQATPGSLRALTTLVTSTATRSAWVFNQSGVSDSVKHTFVQSPLGGSNFSKKFGFVKSTVELRP